MLDLNKFKNILLASASPRRKFLLEQTGLSFTVVKGEVDEDYPEGMAPEEVAVYLSEKKADHFEGELKDRDTLLITADTLVLAEGRILGKPMDYDDALSMLQSLSGRMHTVITGVTLRSLEKSHTFISTTRVFFKPLSAEEIHYYLDRFRPFDKAGAYGIQEWIGYIGIERIEGSYFNVMGLPVQRLYHELENF